MKLAGKKVLVVGLGKSGLAAARFCLEQGAIVTANDQQADIAGAQELEAGGAELILGEHRSRDFTGADLIVLSPGVDPRQPQMEAARKVGVEVIGELELGFRFLQAPAVMVTGSNGKSTVTSLVGEMLKAAGIKTFVGGNLGIPLCQFVAGGQEAEWAVLEVSSFQIDTATSLCPRIGIIVNITPDHLDRYADFEAYAASKMGLLRHQTKEDLAILCQDDPQLYARRQQAPGRCWLYGCKEFPGPGGWIQGDELVLAPSDGTIRLNAASSPLAGRFNRLNLLAAALAAFACGAKPEAMQSVIDSFRTLPHRLEFVAQVEGVDFYDDSKGTNIGAVKAALAALDQRLVLLLGGRDKEGRFVELGPELSANVRGVVCFGEAGPSIKKQLNGLASCRLAPDLPTALEAARELALPGDAVLLSPGCASFDAYQNYGQRGEHFQALVQEAAHG
jgi:UDP-N-acetylmuramoylalanine--D-glutamate ligase